MENFVFQSATKIIFGKGEQKPRSEIMWASTIAHNDLLSTGRIGDWVYHMHK